MAAQVTGEAAREILSEGVSLIGEIELKSFICFLLIDGCSSFVANNM